MRLLTTTLAILVPSVFAAKSWFQCQASTADMRIGFRESWQLIARNIDGMDNERMTRIMVTTGEKLKVAKEEHEQVELASGLSGDEHIWYGPPHKIIKEEEETILVNFMDGPHGGKEAGSSQIHKAISEAVQQEGFSQHVSYCD